MSSPRVSTTVTVANSEMHELNSSIVGQHYLIKVRLPEDYATSHASYPVLYLPDGDHQFAMASDIVQYLLYGKLIPDLIIVSTAYGSKDTPNSGGTNMRQRDLVPLTLDSIDVPPGGSQYLQFIEQELIPFAESNYRIDATDRTLAGGSLGALFVLWAMLERPGLFQRIIALDGWDERFSALEAAYAASHQALPVRLFLGWARAGWGHAELPHFAARLESRAYKGFSLESSALAAATHFEVPGEGLTRGLISVFRR